MKLGLNRGSIFKIGQILMTALLIFFSGGVVSHAQEKAQDKEVVVLLDCSKSMEDVDEQYLTFDFTKGLSATIPREYKIGIVAYNEEVCTRLPLGCSYAMIEDELKDIEYKHYGDAGAGLEATIELFSSEQTAKKIILISDGEILMDSEEETEESVQLFYESVKLAKDKNITVDVLVLGEESEEKYTIYAAAEETGGQLYKLRNSEDLSDYIDQYLFEEWDISGSHIGKLK